MACKTSAERIKSEGLRTAPVVSGWLRRRKRSEELKGNLRHEDSLPSYPPKTPHTVEEARSSLTIHIVLDHLPRKMLLKLLPSLQIFVLGAQIGLVSGVKNRQAPAQWVIDNFTPTVESPVTTAGVDNKCSRDPANVAAEFAVAARMATIAASNFNEYNQYVQASWPNKPEETRIRFLDPFYLNRTEKVFECVARAATNVDAGECGKIDPIRETCVQDEGCRRKNGYFTHAHTNARTMTINLCEAFFNFPHSAEVQCDNSWAVKSNDSKGRIPHAFMFSASGTSCIVGGFTNAVQQPDCLFTK